MNKYNILTKGIVKSGDKYLVVEKWYDDRIADPYEWEFITSSIEFGEDPDTEVIRLINEQTGLLAVIDKILYTWTFKTGDVFNIGISYLCITDMQEVILSEELNNYAWISRDEFSEYIGEHILKDIDKSEL